MTNKQPKTFSNLFRNFCLEGTISGLKYFYLYPDFISRCFWLSTMAVVVLLACQLMWSIFTRFMELPTRLTIENQYEPANNFPYPAITLCSPNQMTASFMRHFNKTLVDGNISIDLEKVLPMMMGFSELIKELDEGVLRQMQTLLDKNRYTIFDIMTESPQRCENFLKMCIFDGQPFKCSELFTPILTTHGLCCAFNSIYHLEGKRNVQNSDFKVKNVGLGSIRNGLIVVTDYHPENAVDNTILYGGTIRVMYTDHTEFPADDESTLVESHVESYHVIRAVHTYCSEDVSAMPPTTRKCFFDTEHSLPWFGSYRNSDCDHTCFALAVEKACHCHLFYLPNPKIKQLCDLTTISCILRVKVRMKEWVNLDECDCPEDCEERDYKVELSIGNYDAVQHMIYNPFESIKFNQSTSTMYFYFDKPTYVKQKLESITSPTTFVSNLGGVFGLCLGCSGISLLEIMSYSYAAIKFYIQKKTARNTVQHFEYQT